MSEIKEFNLIEVRQNSAIINNLNNVFKLWGYEEISPTFINSLQVTKANEVLNEEEIVQIISNNSLCLRPEMTTSIVKLTTSRLINKKRPLRLFNNGIIFEKKKNYTNNIKINEKLQSGIELIGYDTKFPEIEIINLLFEAIDKVNLRDSCNLTLLVSTTTIMKIILNKYIDKNYENIKKSIINLDLVSLNNIDIDDNDKLLLKELIFTRGEPKYVLNKLNTIFGNNNKLDDLYYLFEKLNIISNKYNIKIQLDPTFQPHLNLYAGIVFQLISEENNNKVVIAKGGRYDELVRYFNPKEKVISGLGFTISVDSLRELIIQDVNTLKKVLILIKDIEYLEQALIEQKKLHNSNIITILDLNPCNDISKAKIIMKENNCTEIKWIN